MSRSTWQRRCGACWSWRRRSDGQVQTQIPDDLLVLAQPELLFRALANLVRNAVRYAGHAGPITVSALRKDGEVVVTVADQGPGVPEASLQQIFDPFFRGEPSRSRDTGGVGSGAGDREDVRRSLPGHRQRQ